MRRTLLVLALALGVLVFTPGPALACSCVESSVAELVDRADSVGVGTVRWTAVGPERTARSVRFEEVLKGELGEVEKVYSPGESDTCATELAEQKRYLFFMQGAHRGRLTFNLCTSPEPATNALLAQVRTQTGESSDPVPVPASEIEAAPQDYWWAPWAVGLVAVGIVGVAVFLGRRRLRRTPGELDARTGRRD